jgi:hypothetical protein
MATPSKRTRSPSILSSKDPLEKRSKLLPANGDSTTSARDIVIDASLLCTEEMPNLGSSDDDDELDVEIKMMRLEAALPPPPPSPEPLSRDEMDVEIKLKAVEAALGESSREETSSEKSASDNDEDEGSKSKSTTRRSLRTINKNRAMRKLPTSANRTTGPLNSSSGRIRKTDARRHGQASSSGSGSEDDESEDEKNDMQAPTPLIQNKTRRHRPSRHATEFDDDDDDDDDDDYGLVHASQYMAYSWDSLQLGTVLGSAAYNSFLRNQMLCDPSIQQVPQLTPQQTLQIMQSLRPRTIIPPTESGLHSVVQHNLLQNRRSLYEDSDNDDWGDYRHEEDEEINGGKSQNEEESSSPRLPFGTLARLYENMCSQDVDDWSSFRREAQYLRGNECMDKLQEMESEITTLKEREQRILQTGRDLGFRGVRLAEDVYQLLAGLDQPRTS